MSAAAGPPLVAALLLAGLPGPASFAASEAAGADAAAGRALFVFTLEDGHTSSPRSVPPGPLPIGSLAKPFVARAWARAHPRTPSPVLRCTPASRCWNASGHGTVGLVRATAVSCNTYFRALAAATPEAMLAGALRAAGLRPPDPLSPEAAIGLPSAAGLVSAEPAALLRAYAALLREPWGLDEPLRRELLTGLRDSAREGTAAGLSEFGFHAKTGTVPAIDGRPLATSGWAVAVDESGRGFLGLLTPGTGREAARALALRLRAGSARAALPAAPRARAGDRGGAPPLVRVSLFGALAPRRVSARNAGSAPVAGSRGFVGPGASLELRAGDRLENGDWELSLPASGLRRVVRGAVRADAGPHDVLRVLALLAPVEYVSGVIAAELASAEPELRVALGAAVLRFLAEGSRHGDSDVCDLTHCAFFIGRGPRAQWPSPGRALVLSRPGDAGGPAAPAAGIEPGAWDRMLSAARQPGPARWTSHCGGEPLSPHTVWGGDDLRVYHCSRHPPLERAPWSRVWPQGAVDRALGGRVDELRLAPDDGIWTLLAVRQGVPLSLRWDEAHARLAGVLGWGALPSPADRVVRDAGGFRATGRGLGHRVGLCLGARAPDASRPLLD